MPLKIISKVLVDHLKPLLNGFIRKPYVDLFQEGKQQIT